MLAALDTNQAQTIGVLAIVGVVVIGLLLSIVITAVVGRVLLVVVVVGLGVLLWTQRQTVEHRTNKCDTNVSFLGIDLQLSASAEQHCAGLKR